MKFLHHIGSVLLCALLASCAFNQEKMTRPDGSTYQATNAWLGGDHMAQTSSGSKYASSMTTSFRDAVTGATAIVGSIAYAKNVAAEQATQQAATAGANKTAQVATQEATKQIVAKEATKQTGMALEAGAEVLPLKLPLK